MADNNTSENNTQRNISVKDFLLQNKYDSCLWLIRLYIIFCTICYIIPVLGVEFSQSCFKRVLLGCASISALRLHQRMPRIQFSLQFAKELFVEDSFHYLAYSILFLYSNAATMVLMPIFIFAVMHAASYTRRIIELYGCKDFPKTGFALSVTVSGSNSGILLKVLDLIRKIQNQETQQQMLTFIATTEIMVFPVSILMVFSGQSTILVPFFYYRFLQLRYASRRNPYSRTVFSQFRLGMDQLSYHPKCPGFARKILQGIISLAVRMAPATSS